MDRYIPQSFVFAAYSTCEYGFNMSSQYSSLGVNTIDLKVCTFNFCLEYLVLTKSSESVRFQHQKVTCNIRNRAWMWVYGL